MDQTNKIDWAVKCADTMLQRTPKLDTDKWRYEDGLMLNGIFAVYLRTGNPLYLKYIQDNLDLFVSESGTIKGYSQSEFQLDNINNGKILLDAYGETHEMRYRKAADTLFRQFLKQPRTQEGVFWHKAMYPDQVWLDGIYMGDVFYARYQKEFGLSDGYQDAAQQVIKAYELTRDLGTGLCYHAYDGRKSSNWANKETGHSPHFWTRSIGWFVMAMVDILDYLPKTLPERNKIIAILRKQLTTLVLYSDTKTKLWYQVTDEGDRPLNYLESSGSLMILNAIAKSLRKGYLNGKEWQCFLEKSYQNALSQFISIDNKGFVNVHKIVYVSGLGGAQQRDGSFSYYMSEPIVTNDNKGIGPFLMLTNELKLTNSLS